MKLNPRVALTGPLAIAGAITLLAFAAPAFSQVKLPPLKVRVGQTAPNFVLPSASGKMLSLSSFRGHNVLIDFYEGYW